MGQRDAGSFSRAPGWEYDPPVSRQRSADFLSERKVLPGIRLTWHVYLAHNHTTIQGEAHLDCHCGAGKFWHKLR